VGCSGAEYRFILWNGSSWSIVQEWSASPTFNWTTTGLPAGGYVMEVWTRVGSVGGLQAYTDVGYTLTSSSNPCTAVSVVADPSSPRPVGTAVTWTASAVGCSGAEYRFILWNGSSWWVLHACPTRRSSDLTTTGLPAGGYVMEVWTRVGSVGGLQAYTDVGYTLTSSSNP